MGPFQESLQSNETGMEVKFLRNDLPNLLALCRKIEEVIALTVNEKQKTRNGYLGGKTNRKQLLGAIAALKFFFELEITSRLPIRKFP